MAGTATPRSTAPAGNIWLDALLWGTAWSSGGAATVVSTYIAGRTGAETVADGLGGSVTARVPSLREVAAMKAAMASIEAVCGLDFRIVGSPAQADLVWSVVGSADSPDAYGWSTPPGLGLIAGEARSLVAINHDAYLLGSGPGLLLQGGFDYVTFVHELGHAVGLAHPHDRGGGSPLFPGVQSAFGDLGRHGMNQGVFTTMSYNDGWQTGPQGLTPSPTYGYQAGPMALDIAALQFLYGANPTTGAGDDSYGLPGANRPGTAYACLWDAGGTDRLLGAPNRPNLIDLRAATLADGPGAGGFPSHAGGVHGGLTIAHGVVIEEAQGGSLADRIRGNGAGNTLLGLGGDDVLWGGQGADVLGGGAGDDRLVGGPGGDRLVGAGGADGFVFRAAGHSVAGAGRDRVTGFAPGEDGILLTWIDADPGRRGDQAFRLDADGSFGTGEIRQSLHVAGLLLEMNLDGDAEAEMSILLRGLAAPLSAADFAL